MGEPECWRARESRKGPHSQNEENNRLWSGWDPSSSRNPRGQMQEDGPVAQMLGLLASRCG